MHLLYTTLNKKRQDAVHKITFHKRQKSPTAETAETVGDSQLNIKVYLKVRPLVDSALTAEAVHVCFCIFAGHNEGSELLVGDLSTTTPLFQSILKNMGRNILREV